MPDMELVIDTTKCPNPLHGSYTVVFAGWVANSRAGRTSKREFMKRPVSNSGGGSGTAGLLMVLSKFEGY
jgi:hypothetical protein